jgi:hypothetical protein
MVLGLSECPNLHRSACWSLRKHDKKYLAMANAHLQYHPQADVRQWKARRRKAPFRSLVLNLSRVAWLLACLEQHAVEPIRSSNNFIRTAWTRASTKKYFNLACFLSVNGLVVSGASSVSRALKQCSNVNGTGTASHPQHPSPTLQRPRGCILSNDTHYQHILSSMNEIKSTCSIAASF